jgi:hypothetical protein
MLDSLRVVPIMTREKAARQKTPWQRLHFMNSNWSSGRKNQRRRYGRVQRGSVGTHAMAIFEQNTPSDPLPQVRHPSVHAVQAAFGPLANSSSGVPRSGPDVALVGAWC